MTTGTLDGVLRHLRTAAGAGPAHDLTDGELLARFRARREEAAFVVLLQRHGPMVLSLCRRRLRDPHAAEDAFQATFLVLARNPAAVRKEQAVGSWLYGVASRIAARAGARAARRRAQERQARPMPRTEPLDETTWQELRDVLDEEVGLLPEKHRAPLVLCYFEGKTHEQAARELGCPKSSLSSRLTRARELLHDRLARRGVTLSAALLAVALGRAAAPAAVPALLTIATVNAARLAMAGKAVTAAGVSKEAATLAEGALRAMKTGSLKAVLILAAVGLAAAGAAVLAQPSPEAKPPAVAAPAPAAAEKKEAPAADLHGDPLPAGALARLGTVRLRHGGTVTCVAFAPDGKTVASGGWDSAASVWDAATGREVRRLALGPDGFAPSWVESVAFSPDGGKTVAVGRGNGDFTVRLYDAAAGKELTRLEGHQGNVYGVAFAPGGKRLLSAALDGTLRLWDLAAGAEEHQANTGHGRVRCLALSANGKTAATGGDDGKVRLWSVPGLKLLHTLAGHGGGVSALAFSPDGKALASAGRDGTLRLWAPAAGKELRAFGTGQAAINSLAFSPDGTLLASGGQDRTICLRDPATGKELRRLHGHQHAVQAVAFSHDGKRLVSGAWDHTVRLWDVAGGKELGESRGHEHYVSAVAFAPDGKAVATGGDDSTLRLWDPFTGKQLRSHDMSRTFGPPGAKLPPHYRNPNPLRAVAYSPRGGLLAVAGMDIELWDPAAGKKVRALESSRGGYQTMTFSPDGSMIAAGGHDAITLWDAATGKLLRRLPGDEDFVRSVCFSPDGKTLATVSQGRGAKVVLWEAATGKELRRIDPECDMPFPLAFAPDGTLAVVEASRQVAVGGTTVRLYDPSTGKAVGRLHTPARSVACMAFSPDGRTLAAGEVSVYLTEVMTGQPRAAFHGHRGAVQSLSFAPDGSALASCGRDTSALVWDLTGLRSGGRPGQAKLSPKQAAAHWDALAGSDAAQAYRAVWALASDPERALPLLKDRLRPVPAGNEAALSRLIRDLSSERFADREQAMKQLEQQGESAAPSLRKALAGEVSLEVRRRLEQLLDRLDRPAGAQLRALRAVEVLEHTATPDAVALLRSLAAGEAEARLTREAQAALCRLSRRPAP